MIDSWWNHSWLIKRWNKHSGVLNWTDVSPIVSLLLHRSPLTDVCELVSPSSWPAGQGRSGSHLLWSETNTHTGSVLLKSMRFDQCVCAHVCVPVTNCSVWPTEIDSENQIRTTTLSVLRSNRNWPLQHWCFQSALYDRTPSLCSGLQRNMMLMKHHTQKHSQQHHWDQHVTVYSLTAPISSEFNWFFRARTQKH